MELRISLIRHVQKAVQVLGGLPPQVVEKDVSPGEAKCSILLDVCKITQSSKAADASDHQLFSGEHPYNLKIAEHRAVMAVKNFLEDAFCLQFHDHSADKIKLDQEKMDCDISKLKALSIRVQSFIKQYESAISLLTPVHSLLSGKESSVITALLKTLSELCTKPEQDIQCFKDEVVSLDAQFAEYDISQATGSKVVKVVCHFGGKEFLSDVLALVELPQAQYSVSLHEKDVFKGTCSISPHPLNSSSSSVRVNIQGQCKSSPIDAEESAAAHALIYLEHAKNFDLVDFNYDSLMFLRKRHDQLLKLRLDFMSLVSCVYKSWSEFVSQVDSMVLQQVGRLEDVFWDAELEGDYEDIVIFCRGVQDAVYEIWKMQHNALSEVSAGDS